MHNIYLEPSDLVDLVDLVINFSNLGTTARRHVGFQELKCGLGNWLVHGDFKYVFPMDIAPVDPSTFLGSVWGMIWGVRRTFSGGVWGMIWVVKTVKRLLRRCLDP